MNRVYQTGETDESLHARYNPEGSQMREKQMRMLDMLLYIQQTCERLEIPFYIDGGRGHFLRNVGKTEAKVLWVSTPPSF